MTEIRHFAGWLRSLAGLAAVAGALALSGCGGGSGAPNNFFDQFITVTPSTAVAYSGVPTTLTINGGAGPFQVTSSNSAVLPPALSGRTVVLLANNVTTDTPVNITVKDLGPLINQTEIIVPVTVRAAPLLNSFTITPNLQDCGTAVCSGQTATASVVVRGPEGGPLAKRPVRFDVVGSAYAIVTNNLAQPLTNSLTVETDSTGTASVVIKANTNAPAQVAQMSVTDLTSGQTLTGNFTIVQITDGSEVLTVVPDETTITGPFTNVCSTGFRVAYFIYGGTPPYRINNPVPTGVTLVNPVVNDNGGSFEVITNGTCLDGVDFSIVDATGRQTTAALTNEAGSGTPPVVTPAIAVSPPNYGTSGSPINCTGATFNFVITGGLPPYNVASAGGIVDPNPVDASPGSVAVSGFVNGSGSHQVLVGDSSIPQKSDTATINCM